MRFWSLILVLVLVMGVLAGCGGDVSTSVEEGAGSDQNIESSSEDMGYASQTFDTSYEGALPVSSQLALGTFELEGTANAITPEQAKTLLSLWQALQGSSLQGDAETNAVLKQIERAMTAEQLAAIVAMQLDGEDLGTWMREQGVNPAPPPDAGTGPEEFAPPSGGAAGQGGFAPPSGMSEEEMSAMRATAEASGGMPGGRQGFGDMSEEERAAMRATAEAGGMASPQGGPARAGGVQLAMLAGQVVELLTARVAQ